MQFKEHIIIENVDNGNEVEKCKMKSAYEKPLCVVSVIDYDVITNSGLNDFTMDDPVEDDY